MRFCGSNKTFSLLVKSLTVHSHMPQASLTRGKLSLVGVVTQEVVFAETCLSAVTSLFLLSR